MVLLLLIYSFMSLPLFVGFHVDLCFGMHYFVSFIVLQSSLRGRERVGCFIFLSYFIIQYDVVGWSAVCDCGIP